MTWGVARERRRSLAENGFWGVMEKKRAKAWDGIAACAAPTDRGWRRSHGIAAGAAPTDRGLRRSHGSRLAPLGIAAGAAPMDRGLRRSKNYGAAGPPVGQFFCGSAARRDAPVGALQGAMFLREPLWERRKARCPCGSAARRDVPVGAPQGAMPLWERRKARPVIASKPAGLPADRGWRRSHGSRLAPLLRT